MNIKKKIIPFIFFAYWVGIPGRWQSSSHCSSEKLLDPLWGKKGLWGLLWVVGVYKTPKNGHLNKWKNANKAPVMGPPMLTQVQFSCSVVSNSLQTRGLQHASPPCPSPTPGAFSNSWPLSQWCHPTISSSVIPFSSCLQSFPVSGSFPVSQLFMSGGQSIGASASASVLPVNIQDWFLLRWTGLIS